MFGFAINSEVIDVLTDETYVDMTVAQYNLINGGKLIFSHYILDFYWEISDRLYQISILYLINVYKTEIVIFS